MSSNSVRDRSGLGLPSKAERRALGKAAAAKRAVQRRRRDLLNKIGRVAVPVAVVGIIVGAIWLFGGGNDDATEPLAGSTPSASPDPDAGWTLPALDPAIATKPTITPGGSTPLTELVVTTLIEGTGPVVQVGDNLRLNFLGAYYATGEEFQGGSTWNNGVSTPYEAQIGVGGFIDGWDQGIPGLTVGSRVRLDIPSALAYPDASGGQPAGDLTFIVDIVGVEA